MKVIESELSGVLLIETVKHSDLRGEFQETYRFDAYQKLGIKEELLQDNYSWSKNNVLRGLHFAKQKPQAQLVTVVQGAIYDVVVDIRPSSKTYGEWYGVVLDAFGVNQIYMPPGFAHGYCVLSDGAGLHYKVSEYYNKSDDSGLMWSDPELAIKWPTLDPEVSDKDLNNIFLKDLRD